MQGQDRIQELVESAQGGDASAFAKLARQYQERLEALVRSRLGPGLEQKIGVEDVVQETFLKAFESLSLFAWQGENSFLRWLSRIAVNVIRETARHEKRGLIIPLACEVADTGISQSKAMRREDRFDRLQNALDSVSPEHRQVILLARVERLPIKEVARRMNRSPEATTQLLWRAIQKLKGLFGDTESLHLLENSGRLDTTPSGNEESRARRLEKLFSYYVDLLNAGKILDREEITESHPDVAEDLIDQLEQFEGLATPTSDNNTPLGTLGDYTLRRHVINAKVHLRVCVQVLISEGNYSDTWHAR